MKTAFWNRLFSRDRGLSCDQVAEVLQQYLDSELDPAETPKVLAHLEKCRDCGLEADLYARIKGTLQTYQQAPTEQAMVNVRALANELATTGLPTE